MREREVKDYLFKRTKKVGGEARKAIWCGRNGAPDDLLLFPKRHISIWVETKATGKVPEDHQDREHQAMRSAGMIVEVVDSKESIDAMFWKWLQV